MSDAGGIPHVTGISPNEGCPGTELTIRGENLGKTAKDLTHVFINQIDVGSTARWLKPSRISAITPLGDGQLEIVVVTNNNNFGTSSVSYHQTAKRNVGAQISVTYWPVDERRYCPAIYEHGNEAGPESGAQAAGDLDPLTGLPSSEMQKVGIALTDSVLSQLYPVDKSIQITDKDFDPYLLLLKYFKNSKFNDLTATYNCVRKSMRVKSMDESVGVIRGNMILIFRCLEGMDVLRSRLLSEKEMATEKEVLEDRFTESLSASRSLGHDLFEVILKRRDRAESIRNAIAVMNRYQFLFNLPHAIRTNICKGDYSLVLNDYRRAKSLFANSDVEVLRRVYGDVENVIANFHLLVRNQLTTMPIDCEEAKRKIDHLVKLEVDYDPTWLCLTHFKEWLIEQIRSYQNAHHSALNTNRGNAGGGNLLPKKGPRLPTSWTPEGSYSETTPALVLVKQICRLLIRHVVQFWRLGSRYVATRSNITLRSSVMKPIDEDDNINSGPDHRDLTAAWTQLNLEVIDAISNTLREELLELISLGVKDKSTPTRYWLPLCIQELRQCSTALPLNELTSVTTEAFNRLFHDLRRQSVQEILHSAQTAIETLHLRETWTTDVTDNEGGTTKLPGLYEDIISEAFERCLDQVSACTHLETSLFESADLQTRFPDWCADAMVAFLPTLLRLSNQIQSMQSQEEDHQSAYHAHQLSHAHVIPSSRGLLLLFNNARWVTRYANPRLLATYIKLGYALPNQLEARLHHTWSRGIEQLANAYIKWRGDWLCKPIRPMLTDYIEKFPRAKPDDRSSCTPKGVHTFIRATVINLSHIYSELLLLLGFDSQQSNGDPKSVDRSYGTHHILSQIVLMLIGRVESSYKSVSSRTLSCATRLQLALDFRFWEAVLPKPLISDKANNMLRNLNTSVTGESDDELNDREKKLLEDLLDKERARMRLIADGFRALETTAAVSQWA